MDFVGAIPSVWVGKNNPQTQAAAARLNEHIRGKVVDRVEGRGDQVVFFFADGTSLAINCDGGFNEVV